MATLYQRKEVWYVAICLPNGNRKFLSTRTRKKSEAQRRALKLESDILDGKYFDKLKGDFVTVRELLDRYVDEHSRPNKRDKGDRDRLAARHLSRVFGKIRLTKLSKYNLAEYVRQRRQDGVTSSTVNLELRTLRHAFNLAIRDWGLIEETPFRYFKMPKPNPSRERYLNSQEVERLYECLPEPMKLIFTLAINTGLRMSNIIYLRWAWVDFKERIITIPPEFHKNGKKHEIVMNDTVMRALISIKSDRKKMSVVSLDFAKFVFLTHLGKPYTKNSAGRAFRRAREKAGILDVRFHDLRHTFLSELAARGASEWDLMFAAGHSDTRMTAKYVHRQHDRQRQIVGLLD